MIKNFKHKGLLRFFCNNDRQLLDAKYCDRIKRILDRLDSSEIAEDMNIPGYGLHKLSGDKRGFWSVKISGNWRITFRFFEGDAYDVNLEDYH